MPWKLHLHQVNWLSLISTRQLSCEMQLLTLDLNVSSGCATARAARRGTSKKQVKLPIRQTCFSLNAIWDQEVVGRKSFSTKLSSFFPASNLNYLHYLALFLQAFLKKSLSFLKAFLNGYLSFSKAFLKEKGYVGDIIWQLLFFVFLKGSLYFSTKGIF